MTVSPTAELAGRRAQLLHARLMRARLVARVAQPDLRVVYRRPLLDDLVDIRHRLRVVDEHVERRVWRAHNPR